MDFKLKLNSFITEIKNTKNLDYKTLKAYFSDLTNFIEFINNQESKIINSENIINYIDSLKKIKKLVKSEKYALSVL